MTMLERMAKASYEKRVDRFNPNHSQRRLYTCCNWGDSQDGGLFFTDLQESADQEGPLNLYWRHVDAALLEEHMGYFRYTMEWARYVRFGIARAQGRPQLPYPWPKPEEPRQPPLHNPPDQHVPPWLNEDQKALHVARAQAAAGGPPTPTPAQQANDARRAAKMAQRAADRERGLAQKKPNEGPKPHKKK